MGRRIVVTGKMGRPSDDDKRAAAFDGRKRGKLGTALNPASIRVQSQKRAKEVQKTCDAHGWTCTIDVEPDQPEDTLDLDRLLYPPQPKVVGKKTGRNEPCPCGSGKKFKTCCGKA
jgi:SWIM/SEC-C metal-binding protein